MLRQRIGLNPESVGEQGLERSIADRMQRSGYSDPEEYARLLSWSQAAWRGLVEELVVGETWFFREEHSFQRLAEQASMHRGGPFRVLCLPCSTGEEAYSAAIALREAKISNFEVHGVDLSEASLTRARQGIYGNYSFRGARENLRELYFRPCAQGWQVAAEIRGHVTFSWGNVAEAHTLSHLQPFDAIFFRNLCIYLEAPARVQAFHSLHALLRPAGELHVALCEAHLPPRSLLVSRSPGNIFGRAQPTPRREATLPRAAVPLRGAQPQAESLRLPAPPRLPTPGESCLLRQARRLADQGRLEEARQLCETYLRTQGPGAQVFYLLAMLSSAAGQADKKEQYLRQALFLEPEHEEALTMMACAAQQSGDLAAARRYRGRLSRAAVRAKAEKP